jgi:hypothetical protein
MKAMVFYASTIVAGVVVTGWGLSPLLLAPSAARADDAPPKVTIVYGERSTTRSFVSQQVAVTNDSDAPMRYLRIECGFFAGGEYKVSGYTILQDLQPHVAGYKEVSAQPSEVAQIDSVKCRASLR